MSRSDEASQPLAGPDSAAAGAMQEHGITRVPVDYFHVGGFRYTSLQAAIAQAKRMAATIARP